MKLYQRITILCASILAAVILSVTVALLLYAKSTILSLATEQVQRKQRTLRTSFTEMANYYARNDDSDAVHDSLIRLCFNRFADRQSVLMRDGEPMVSDEIVDPSAFVPPDSEAYHEGTPVAVTAQGRRLLIVGSGVGVGSRSYAVYVIEDVTDVYARIRRMAWGFALVSVLAVALGAVAVVLSVKGSLRPVASLARTAREIADGAYEKRAAVRTKDEIGLLAADFNRMADAVETKIAELEERNERQRLFIGGVTHEFKTPLTGLLLHAGLLRRAYLSDEERDASLAHIETQTAWLERLVQTLLKLQTTDEAVERQTVRVPELLERVQEGVAPKLEASGASLTVSCDAETMTLCPDLMQSLLLNLLTNAIHSYDADAAEKPIALTVRGKTFSVSDHGRGIPKEAQARIFEPFFTVDKSRSKRQGGSGLGLALVKTIADAHGASIAIDSEPGRGTTVSVSLP